MLFSHSYTMSFDNLNKGGGGSTRARLMDCVLMTLELRYLIALALVEWIIFRSAEESVYNSAPFVVETSIILLLGIHL